MGTGSPQQVDEQSPAPMRILIVSGIFPPDIGGPATHAHDVCTELRARGHEVLVLTLSEESDTRLKDDTKRFPRRWPWPARTLAAFSWILRERGHFDVVYATGLGPIAVAGSRCSRRPVVLKIVGDPAWERSVRRGLTHEDFDAFQTSREGGRIVDLMRHVRNWSTRTATRVVTPSSHLAELVTRWSGRDDVIVIPNGVKSSTTPPRPRAGTALRLVFVGRLVGHKNVDVLIEAVASTQDATLEVIGDGPEMPLLTAQARDLGVSERVLFTGALPHDRVMERLADSDALVLASSYEGLPHVALEALVSGVPVITAGTYGLSDLITDGQDGVVVPIAEASEYRDVFERLSADRSALERLQSGAARTGQQWSLVRTVDRLEALLHEVGAPSSSGEPRALRRN